ncbi:MAG: enoyl-CoA hydratase-related protein [Acidimicrobiia bacterium]
MQKVTTELRDGVLTVTLTDPEKRNVLSRQLSAEFVEALDRAESDDEVRVVVVTNEGHVFCAGADLSERSSGDDDGSGDAPTPVDPAQLFRRITNSRKPFVGRIAGHAVAGGMGLAAAMDLSVAVDDAKFGFTEVRIGVAPAVISVVCLPKMRRADAAAAFLRGNRFLAPDAARIGIINEAVPADELDATVDRIVADLLEGSPQGLAAAKELMNRVPTMAAADAFAWTAELSSELFTSDEAQAGMTSYLEKKPPPWSPRS